MAAAAVSSSNVGARIIPTDDAVKRRKGAEQTEEKMSVCQPESELLFDPGPLCGSIYLELLDGNKPAIAANQIVRAFPEILFSLSVLEKSQILAIIQEHLNLSQYDSGYERDIKATVLILFSTSLMNSSIGESAKVLEKGLESVRGQVPDFLKRSDKGNAAALIKRAREISGSPVAADVPSIQAQLTAINRITDEINHFLSLFFYGGSPQRAKFENIYSYSDQFPNCKRCFNRFMQNLDICKHEEAELISLRSKMHQQTLALLAQMRELQAPQVQRLSDDREKMLEHQAVLLWNSGTKLLEQGIKTIFFEKWKHKTFIPDDFAAAVRKASQPQEFRRYTFNDLVKYKIDKLPAQFVSNVWDYYLKSSRIVDIADLMRIVIARLPEATFKKLEADLKTSENKEKTVLDALNEYFATQWGGSFTLIALKNWLR
jgi:hypothetical protein